MKSTYLEELEKTLPLWFRTRIVTEMTTHSEPSKKLS